MERVFVDIDTQKDFICPDGNLSVRGAFELVANLHQLTTHAVQHSIPVLATADTHLPDDPEFAEFPAHCVRGTSGQQRIAETELPGADTLAHDQTDPDAVRKWTRAGAVILEKRTLFPFGNVNADILVSAAGDAEFVVYGVATDYCIKYGVLGLLERGKRVTLVTDAIKGIDPKAEAETLEEFRRRGVRFKTTAEVCRSCDPSRTTSGSPQQTTPEQGTP